MKSYASPSPEINGSDDYQIILLEDELPDKKLPNDKRIMVQACYLIKGINGVVVTAILIDRPEENSSDSLQAAYLSIRFKSGYEPSSVKVIFSSENKDYFDELVKANGGKEVSCFYHCDPNVDTQEDDIWVRYLPHSIMPHIPKTKNPPSKMPSVGGMVSYLFGLFTPNVFKKSDVNAESTVDRTPKAGM